MQVPPPLRTVLRFWKYFIEKNHTRTSELGRILLNRLTRKQHITYVAAQIAYIYWAQMVEFGNPIPRKKFYPVEYKNKPNTNKPLPSFLFRENAQNTTPRPFRLAYPYNASFRKIEPLNSCKQIKA